VPTPEEYRRLAAECLELAPKISSDLRDIFISLTQGWARLAEFLEEDKLHFTRRAADRSGRNL